MTFPPTNISVGLCTVSELKEKLNLQVSGTIPTYLSQTTLYRLGPGRYNVNHADNIPYKVQHWFDGLSMLHAFHIDASRKTVKYSNRSLTDDMIRSIESTKSTEWNEYTFGSMDPCRSIFGKLFQLLIPSPKPVDPLTGVRPRPNIGVTLQDIPGRGLSIRSDMGYNLKLNEETLEIDEFFGFNQINEQLKGDFSAAHGHYDSKTGEFFNYVFNLNGSGKTEYSIFKIDSEGRTKNLAKIMEFPSYLHSFAATDNYIILIVWPMRINPLQVLWTKSTSEGSKFHSDAPTTFYVISRHGENGIDKGVVKVYTSRAFFCFHTVNAYEQDDDIIIDLCRYDDSSIVHEFKLDNLRSTTKLSQSTLSRFVLKEIKTLAESFTEKENVAIETVINGKDLELATIHPERQQRFYRYVYGVSNEEGIMDAVSKVDVTNGKRSTWAGHNIVVGEPIFVPDPAGTEEDDGCLLVVVLNASVNKSSLVVLDAKNLTKIASADVPQVVPLGFHGMAKAN